MNEFAWLSKTRIVLIFFLIILYPAFGSLTFPEQATTNCNDWFCYSWICESKQIILLLHSVSHWLRSEMALPCFFPFNPWIRTIVLNIEELKRLILRHQWETFSQILKILFCSFCKNSIETDWKTNLPSPYQEVNVIFFLYLTTE